MYRRCDLNQSKCADPDHPQENFVRSRFPPNRSATAREARQPRLDQPSGRRCASQTSGTASTSCARSVAPSLSKPEGLRRAFATLPSRGAGSRSAARCCGVRRPRSPDVTVGESEVGEVHCYRHCSPSGGDEVGQFHQTFPKPLPSGFAISAWLSHPRHSIYGFPRPSMAKQSI